MFFALLLLATACNSSDPVVDENMMSVDARSVERPEPVVIGGHEVRWVKHESDCPDGWYCSPCWLPEPAQIEDDEGRIVPLPVKGCYPPLYVASGEESLREIADSADAEVDALCVDEEYLEQPEVPLPPETHVSLC